LGSRGAFPPSQEGPQAPYRSDSFEARRKLTAAEGLPRACRLTRTSELRKVQETGKRKRLAHLDVLWTDNQAGHPRVGLIVPKFQSSAVARNRLRRRLREVWRRELKQDLASLDVVIRARREAYGAEFTALSSELLTWRQGMG
jgi:ribonuclease P protein component